MAACSGKPDFELEQSAPRLQYLPSFYWVGCQPNFQRSEVLQDKFKGISQGLACMPYVNTNRSPRTCSQLREHLEILPLTKRGKISIQALDEPLLYWSTKSFGAGTVLYSSLQTQTWHGAWHREGTQLSQMLNPAGGRRGPI